MYENITAFIIYEDRQIDYYISLFNLLSDENVEFCIITNDLNANFINKEYLLSLTNDQVQVINLSEVLSKKIRFKQVVSVNTYQTSIKNISLGFNVFHARIILEFLIFTSVYKILNMYAKTIGSLLTKKEIHHKLQSMTGFTFCLDHHLQKREYLIAPELLISKKRILFPKGLDFYDTYPGKTIFNTFLAISRADEQVIKNNTKGNVIIIGYPRYDLAREHENAEIDRFKEEFQLDKNKKTILWIPSRQDWQKNQTTNIEAWIDNILNLRPLYNIIVRPHPHVVRATPNILKELSHNGILLDIEEKRSLKVMYSYADYVLVDSGGSMFSSVYLNKPILILDADRHDYQRRYTHLENELRNIFPVFRTYSSKKTELFDFFSEDRTDHELQNKLMTARKKLGLGDIEKKAVYSFIDLLKI